MNYLGHGHVRKILGTSLAWGELGEEHAKNGRDPIVLLHGVGDSHRSWRRVAPILAKHDRVLMPDLPGHGLSGRPDAPYTLAWYADVLHAWLDAIGVDRVRLVGHSYGGGVAQWMLLERASRVSRLALVAPGGLGRSVFLGLRLPTLPVIGKLLTPLLMGPGTRVIMKRAVDTHSAEDLDEIEQLAFLNGAPGSGRAFYRTIAGCIDMRGQTVQAQERIAEVARLPPTCIIWGARDPILPVSHAHEAKGRLEGATFHIYEKSGHCPQLDAPEQLAGELRTFFQKEQRSPIAILEPQAARVATMSGLLERIRGRAQNKAA